MNECVFVCPLRIDAVCLIGSKTHSTYIQSGSLRVQMMGSNSICLASLPLRSEEKKKTIFKKRN